MTRRGQCGAQRRWRAARTCRALIGLGALLALPTLASDGVETLGVSFHDRARGGVDVAIGDTALSQLINPASLSNHPQGRFDFASELIMPKIRWWAPIDHVENQIRHVPVGGFGVVLPGEDGWSFGLAAYAKAGLMSRYKLRHLGAPLFRRHVGADVTNLSFEFNAARRVNERFAVGFGGRIETIEAAFSEVLGPVDVEFQPGEAIGGGFQVGLRYDLTPALTVGAAYRSPTWFTDIRGGDARGALLGLVPLELGPARITNVTTPQRVSVGLAWKATDWLTLGGEARYVNYEGTTWNGASLRLDRFGLGMNLPIGYRDQWIFKVGGDVRLDEHWVVSAGYSYATNPVEPETLSAISSIFTTHHVTTGLRYEQHDWWVGVGGAIGFRQRMSAGGKSHIPMGWDYAGSTVEHAQYSVFVGFGFSL